MAIRAASERDLDAILEIERASFEKPWDRAKCAAALGDVFLVLDEGQVVGFLSACCPAVGDVATIMKIAVHPAHRGRGIATSLMEAALEELRKRQFKEVELHVDILRAGAIRLYERLGFTVRKVVTADYEENEAFYEMKLALDKQA